VENHPDYYAIENPFGLETESEFHKARMHSTISSLKEHIKDAEENSILDVGCGKGKITMALRKNFSNLKIDALDISSIAIDFALKSIQGVNFFVADATKYAPKGTFYNAIVLNNIYEHVENPILLLNNLKNLLKQNGVFIISTPNRFHIKNIMRVILGFSIKVPKYHVTEYSISQLYDHHAYTGLEIVRLITPKFKYEKFKLINFLLFRITQPALDLYLKLRKSRNRLGALLFIISRLRND